MFDRHQRLIVCNAQFAKIYGWAPEQTKPGTPLQTIIETRAALAPLAGRTHRILSTERLNRRLCQWRPTPSNKLPDGRTISITRQAMGNGGWVSIHQDITAQKSIEMPSSSAWRATML